MFKSSASGLDVKARNSAKTPQQCKTKELEDLVAVWEVSLAEGKFLIEFEHGTTTGKRVTRCVCMLGQFSTYSFKAKSKINTFMHGQNYLFI